MLYIGDGLTDYYAMNFVKQNGGITIFVYQEEKDIEEIDEKDVVTFYTSGNFLPNSKLNNYIMNLYSIKN